MGTANNRQLAWIYLRRVIEASRMDLLGLLWPDGDSAVTADVERVAGMIRMSDPALPGALRSVSATRSGADPGEDARWAGRAGWRLITPDDAEWPRERLDDAFNANDHDTAVDGIRGQAARPFALWARGTAQLGPATERSVAMVGTRSATTYGNTTTFGMAGDLAAAGYTVVSGGAVGIDTAAHRGALSVGGTTVVVLANGPGHIYPKANGSLFDTVAQHGLVVTEYPPLQRPARHRFLTRNRLVAALTQGTVLMAAGYRSGAVNTANWADQMVTPVMVLPGPVNSADYVGCHKRIRDGGGILVTRAMDVREVVEPLGAVDADRQLSLEFAPTDVQQLTQQQLRVYDSCGIASDTSGRPGDIAVDGSLDMRDVVRVIGELEDLGLVVRDGSRWIKIRRPG
ncbi:MAG: DNA-processing protein DprA [Mycobacteriaceae bacterium]